MDSHYLYKFGESLGKIHQLHLNAAPAPNLRFHKYLTSDVIEEYQLTPYQKWLEKHEPSSKEQAFIHGDHHYANLLWDNHKLVGVLDWEFSGIGCKSNDISYCKYIIEQLNELCH